MTTVLTAIVALVLAGATAVGVTKAVSDDTQRTSGETSTSSVVPYGEDK